MKAYICTLLGCVTFALGVIDTLNVYVAEGERWRALERTKYILDHQLPKPNVDKPSIEIPAGQEL